MIVIDGSQGEGGGQILRTALSLAVITARSVSIHSIRAGRAKPGLLRQHLVCVEAAAEIADARVVGAALGSRALEFTPSGLRGGEYRFAIGSAGSTMLVLQTVLPMLLRADSPSEVTIEGGTHNPMAPPFEFVERAFLPLLRRMGASIDLTLRRPGFYPVGGGSIHARFAPSTLQPLHLPKDGERKVARATAFVANLPLSIAERELAIVKQKFAIDPRACRVEATRAAASPGNALSIEVDATSHVEVFTGLGERGKSAENVALEVVDAVRAYLESGASVGEYLIDQILLPLALAGGGSFYTSEPSQHALTNAGVIEQFLPVAIEWTADAGRTRCDVRGQQESGGGSLR